MTTRLRYQSGSSRKEAIKLRAIACALSRTRWKYGVERPRRQSMSSRSFSLSSTLPSGTSQPMANIGSVDEEVGAVPIEDAISAPMSLSASSRSQPRVPGLIFLIFSRFPRLF